MKILTSIFLALTISSCQWIITHPEEDEEIVEISEKAIQEIYSYECGQQILSPSPPTGEIKPKY